MILIAYKTVLDWLSRGAVTGICDRVCNQYPDSLLRQARIERSDLRILIFEHALDICWVYKAPNLAALIGKFLSARVKTEFYENFEALIKTVPSDDLFDYI